MLTNNQMTAGRYLDRQYVKRLWAKINAAFDAGGSVYSVTYTKATRYRAKHRDMFKVSSCGRHLLIQHGRKWLIAYSGAWRTQYGIVTRNT